MFAHVALYDVPIPYVLNTVGFVATQCAARVPVAIQDGEVLEPRAGRPKREPSSTDEEFKRFQG